MRVRGWGRSLCILGLANPAPGLLLEREAADTTKVQSVPFYGKLHNPSDSHCGGAQIGYAFHGHSVHGDSVRRGKRATGGDGLKGLLGRVLVATR